TLAEKDTITYLRGFGDYQAQIGDLIPEGTTFTFDISEQTEFVDNVEEVKPQDDLFAFIFDVNAIKYKRNTNGMLKEPFNNPEFDEVTHWIHYYSFKSVSPFFNKILITSEPTEE
ncbi:MAG: hypothetical protein L0L07_08840, partial [Staphylococcus equorum]|nr:hypothetical protein [Staphylococcus equorum]